MTHIKTTTGKKGYIKRHLKHLKGTDVNKMYLWIEKKCGDSKKK